jgi:hypothetical protein
LTHLGVDRDVEELAAVNEFFKTEDILLAIHEGRKEDTIVEVPMVIELGILNVGDGLMALPAVEKGTNIM